MSLRLAILASSALALSACGGETNQESASSTDATEVAIVAQALEFSIEHGETANDYQLNWTVEPVDTDVTIRVSNDPDMGNALILAEGATGGKFSWKANGEPERHYFEIVPTGGEPLRAAVRLLPLEGGRNFRDLGGYETEDGRRVKWGRAFRSGVMTNLTGDDYKYLSGLGIQTICDFREADEREREPTNWEAGAVEYLTFSDSNADEDPADNPMFAALMTPDATPEDVAQAMAAGYVGIVEGEAEGYTAMFDRLATGEIPLAFNCSAGKDRAGTAAALLLTVLGVPRETVVHDYSLSDDYVDFMAEFLSPEARAEAEADPDNPYAFLFQLPPEKVAPLMASDPMYIEASFAAMEAEHGTVLGFIQAELDVTDAEIEAIRGALLE